MKENEDKNIEHYVHTAIKETPVESPSHDFTSNVMASVLAVDASRATAYKPLISKKGWVLIFTIVAAMGYCIVNGSTQSEGKAWSFSASIKDFINTFDVPLFQFSRITANVIVLATIMILIQITWLKNHLNKRQEKQDLPLM